MKEELEKKLPEVPSISTSSYAALYGLVTEFKLWFLNELVKKTLFKGYYGNMYDVGSLLPGIISIPMIFAISSQKLSNSVIDSFTCF